MSVIIARDVVREPLYAVVPVFNPWRWKSRIKHTERTLKHFHDIGAVIILVEIGFNRRELVFKDNGLDGTLSSCPINDSRFRHKYIGLHTKDELWLKENAINVGVQNCPYDWQQVGWFDSDIQFARPNIIGSMIHALQHYSFIQPFTQARDLGPNYEMLDENYPHASGMGFVHAWKEGFLNSTVTPEIAADLKALGQDISILKEQHNKLSTDLVKLEEDLGGYYGKIGERKIFPGLVMACTRPAWDAVGGLFAEAIWGGGDWHMSHALIEKTEGMMRHDLHKNYKKLVMQWYQRCRTHIRQNVGVVEGSVFHNWHGKKIGRGYNTKHALLAKFGFDPLRHLKKDSQGLYQLHDDRSTSFVQIRDMLRRIAIERNEDSIDI
jgi:hypothetical protein